MKVGLIHRGGALPNLALMRLSSFHKQRGNEVLLNPTPLDGCDRVYVSTLFTWQRKAVLELAAHFQTNADVRIGGSGWDLDLRLPPAVDVQPNDYSLYGLDYGIGYSSRGCIRDCDFCPVPTAEGAIREDQPLGALLNPHSNRLILLDNNFFASEWRPKIAEIERRGLVVDWPQGNDIRLMTPEIAAALGRLRVQHQLETVHGRKQTLHFAWDTPTTAARARQVIRGIQALFAVGFIPRDLRFMVLVGFPGYELDEELERIQTLHRLGIEPVVMVYRDYGDKDTRDQKRIDLARWNNRHAHRRCSFAEFRRSLRTTDQGPRTVVDDMWMPWVA